MNDRFKFRVWHKPSSSWIPEKDLALTSDGKVLIAYERAIPNDGDKVDPFFSPVEVEFGGFKENAALKQEDLVIVQSTGLKDKNGKLIFESAIIKICEGGYVTSHGEEAILPVEYIDGGFAPFANSIDECHCVQLRYTPVEIIGNIYENPNLLKND
jgi:uncharacterized phage protein (TIGR01671 family)